MHNAVLGFDSTGKFQQESLALDYLGYPLVFKRAWTEHPLRDGVKVDSHISNQLVFTIQDEIDMKAQEAGLKFLSELSWLYEIAILDVSHGFGDGLRMISQFVDYKGMRKKVDLSTYKPLLLDDEQRLAVGLFKEGISNNSPFYRFFSLYNVIPETKRKKWLEGYFEDRWDDDDFKGRFHIPSKSPEELVQALWVNGRCAIAHNDRKPKMDVHNFPDIGTGLVFYLTIKEAAEQYMINEMGISRL